MRSSRQSFRSLAWLALAIAAALGLLGAAVLRQARASGGEPLKPNLVADPPNSASFETSSEGGASVLLLRFNGYVHNTGPGALDIRARREAPKVKGMTEQQVEEEVQRAKAEGRSLPAQMESELAVPAMDVFQRLFTTNVGEEETNIERPHRDEPSPAEVFYANADGHHHWHLQHVAAYSLWNATKTGAVAPSQKVGFCLEDSEHEETGIGPKSPVYADNVPPYRAFCQQYRPNATSLFEGISPGWRDFYKHDLALQWVDVSNVLPGEYWLREDVNPERVIEESGGGQKSRYAEKPTIVRGFDAVGQLASTQAGEARTLTLTSRAWEDSNTPRYTIVSQPRHGTLGPVSKNQVTYTPEAGFSGTDSFTFAAADPTSPFPRSPATATVTVEVSEPSQPSVTIEGAPASMAAGTSVQLSARVSGDSPTVTWSASAGSITSAGLYTAPAEPPPGGSVTVTALTSKGAHDQRTIEIAPASALLVGDATSSYPVKDQTRVGHEEAFQFTASATGTVEELQFLTGGEANTGVSGLALGLFAEGAGKPGAVLASGRVSGQPPADSWIGAAIAATDVRAGSRYWLVALPLGSGSAELHFAAAHAQGAGAGNLESALGSLNEVAPESSWNTFNQGPVGFQALGPRTSVEIEDAPLSMIAGTSVQLSARVVADSPTVSWSASAGSITPDGLYTAPSEPPAGGSVTITATSSLGARAQRTIEVTTGPPQPSLSISGAQLQMTAGTAVTLTANVAHDSGGVEWAASAGTLTPGAEGLTSAFQAPAGAGAVTVTARLKDDPSVTAQATIEVVAAPTAVPRPEIPSASTAAFRVSGSTPRLARPRAMLMGRRLVMTTLASVAGRVRLSAYLGRRRIGTCVTQTPAQQRFTCRLTLARAVPLSARIRVIASLRAGRVLLTLALRAQRIPQMRMVPAGLTGARAASAGGFWCSPSTLLPTLASVARR